MRSTIDSIERRIFASSALGQDAMHRVAHQDRRLGRIENDNRLAARGVADFLNPRAVVSVNSSIFCRVPGPALLLAMVATISAYSTGATSSSALTSGTVACPPQLTRVDVARADMLIEIDQRDDVGSDRGGS